MSNFTVGSLFAGIGGFCKAFRDEGFEIIWANEKDTHACKTYKINHPNVHLYEKSIEKLSVAGDEIQRVDILTAGFPCQPFSVAGEKKGFEDPRGKLFFEITRLLNEFGNERPKIVLLENVAHILKHDRGRTFSTIVDELQSAGYWFSEQNISILDTATHTKIPQIRQRIYMAALSIDYFDYNGFTFPAEESATNDYRKYLDLHTKQDDWHYFNEDERWGKLFREALDQGDPDAPYQLRRYYVRELKNKCIPTLTANMGEGGHNQPVIQDEWGIRKLTIQECLGFQGYLECKFPDDISSSQKYKQIGNSVTVPLVRKLALECDSLLQLLMSNTT